MTFIRFDNQVVLVTGAGRGLGAAYARLFGERGAHVVVHDAGVNMDGTGGDPGPAVSIAEEITARGGSAVVETLNLSDSSSCKRLIDNIVSRRGRLDVLVHSAGLVVYTGVEDTTDEEWEKLLHINVEAPFWLSRAIWPVMKRQRYGRIVLTVSGYGLKTFEGSDVTAYGVGKAAQFGLMNGLAGEGKQLGILVNAISPVAATRMFRGATAPNKLLPESVAPGVIVLGSQQCPWTGKVLQAAGGRFGIGEFNTLKEFELGTHPTPEQVLQAIEIS